MSKVLLLAWVLWQNQWSFIADLPVAWTQLSSYETFEACRVAALQRGITTLGKVDARETELGAHILAVTYGVDYECWIGTVNVNVIKGTR